MSFTGIIVTFLENHKKTKNMPWTKHTYLIAMVARIENTGSSLLKRIMLRVYNTVGLNW
jgi:hypothetical protein